jgi:hypothetical protein
MELFRKIANALRISPKRAEKILHHEVVPSYAERYLMRIMLNFDWSQYGTVKEYTYMRGVPFRVSGLRVTIDQSIAVIEAQDAPPRVFRGKSCASLAQRAIRIDLIENVVLTESILEGKA